jgi:hypothetical protein
MWSAHALRNEVAEELNTALACEPRSEEDSLHIDRRMKSGNGRRQEESRHQPEKRKKALLGEARLSEGKKET